ncbi:MAG: hypothetical protein NTU95_02235 [Methanothrix sp.]|nr:hypothetical protein [Methanothrix sp.]
MVVRKIDELKLPAERASIIYLSGINRQDLRENLPWYLCVRSDRINDHHLILQDKKAVQGMKNMGSGI